MKVYQKLVLIQSTIRSLNSKRRQTITNNKTSIKILKLIIIGFRIFIYFLVIRLSLMSVFHLIVILYLINNLVDLQQFQTPLLMNHQFSGQFFQLLQANQTCQVPYYFIWPTNVTAFDFNALNFNKDAVQQKKEIIISRQRCENQERVSSSSKATKQKKVVLKKTISERDLSKKPKKMSVCEELSEAETSSKAKKKTSQNALRNIEPNIVHQIFCFIEKRKRSGRIVKDFIDNQIKSGSQSFSIDRFYLYQKLIKEKTNNYVNIKGLKLLNKFHEPACQVYSQVQQLRFLKMNRILLKHFLENQFNNIVLTSSRMKPESRLLHFQVKRRILQQMTETLNER